MDRRSFVFRVLCRAVFVATIAAATLLLPPSRVAAQNTLVFNVLYPFQGPSAKDGDLPAATMVQGTDGNLYGTTVAGGINAAGFSSAFPGDGIIFKIMPSGQYTVLHVFGDGSVPNDGLVPFGSLVEGPDGDFYGTTDAGGSTGSGILSGDGTVFKITPTGQMTILHSFGDGSVPNDGLAPNAGIFPGSDGNFYGTTTFGGSAKMGTVYKMTPSGQVTILHSFGDGSVPNDGNFFATEIEFVGGDGLILGADGNLYGTTPSGGSKGNGTVFKITPAGQMTILYSFGTVSNDGQFPNQLIKGSDDNFYGTTASGGTAQAGTVFKITPTGQYAILHSFDDGSVPIDGTSPESGLVEGPDGNFYGTTGSGGSNNLQQAGTGNIYKITPSGQVTNLFVFGSTVADSGIGPIGGLTLGTDGYFYGTASGSGAHDFGTIYRFSLVAVPKGLIAIPGNAQVLLDWSASPNATSYNLYRATASGAETLYQSGITTNSYSDAGVTNGTTYYYEVTAVGSLGESGKSNEASATPSTGSGLLSYSAGLQMFSAPYLYAGVSLDTLFGYSNVRLAVWTPSLSQYDITPTPPANSIALGRSYWVRFPHPVSISTGTPAPTNQSFRITLNAGWNMIGDPFLSSVPIANLTFNGGTETFAQATAGANPLIASTVYGYSQASNLYVSTLSLVPQEGYWILAFSNTDMEIPPP